MHFICSTFGSSGDVFPLLGLALELRSRGHEITFATNQHFAGLVAKYDLPFEPLGSEEHYQTCISNPDLWRPRRAFPHVMQCLRPVVKQQYAIHAARAGQRDVVAISNCLGLGALMAQEKLGIPLITLHLQPAVLWSKHEPPALPGLFGPRWMKNLLYHFGERFVIDPVVCPFLNEWRRELGLPPLKRITRWWNSKNGLLCMFPDYFAKPQVDWPGNLLQTDFPLWNHQSDEGLADDVAAFLAAGEPPVVFTPGTANQHATPFFEAAVKACAKLKRRAILLTGFPEQLPHHLPESVAHFPYVPLDLLLPRAAAFVHHGGVGSTSQAMLAGIPQLIMPLAHDQFDNAARIKRLGLGDWIPVKRFESTRVAATLQRILDSSSVAAACKAKAAQLNSRDGLRRSAEAIETLVARFPAV